MLSGKQSFCPVIVRNGDNFLFVVVSRQTKNVIICVNLRESAVNSLLLISGFSLRPLLGLRLWFDYPHHPEPVEGRLSKGVSAVSCPNPLATEDAL